MVGLHATDPATVYLGARARMVDGTVATVENVLYEERRALRMLGMRRTLFVFPLELAAVVQAACTDAIADKLRQRYARMLEQGGIAADGAAWLDNVARATLAALERRGEAFAATVSFAPVLDRPVSAVGTPLALEARDGTRDATVAALPFVDPTKEIPRS